MEAMAPSLLALAAMDGLLMHDRNWSELGRPTGDPDTLPDKPPEAPQSTIDPWAAVPQAAPAARKTELTIVERLAGEIDLAGYPRMAVELTIHYKPAALATLTGPNRKTPVEIDKDKSTLRLFSATDWKRFDLSQADDAERLQHLVFEARFQEGCLRFLHREESGAVSRTLRALGAYVLNRGTRDIWQRFVLPRATRAGRAQRRADEASRPPRPSKTLWKRATDGPMEFINLASHAGQVRRFDYTLKLGSPLQDKGDFARLLAPGSLIEGVKRLTYGRRANPWRQLTQMSLRKLPGLKKEPNGNDPVLELDVRHLARQGLPLITIDHQRNHAEALAELVGFGMYLMRVLLHTHIWSFRKPDRDLAPREVDR